MTKLPESFTCYLNLYQFEKKKKELRIGLNDLVLFIKRYIHPSICDIDMNRECKAECELSLNNTSMAAFYRVLDNSKPQTCNSRNSGAKQH